jgi:chorismate dehydratase
MSAEVVRLGAIAFINTLPVYFRAELPPEVEVVHYLRNKDQLVLLDDLSVSSPGAVESVLLLSPIPLDERFADRATRIYVSSSSETSVALLDVLLRHRVGRSLQERFASYAPATWVEKLAEGSPVLIIGDEALLAVARGLPPGVHAYDLASLWAEMTGGLPFVFAVWVVRRNWADAHPEQLSTVNRQLCQSRDRFFVDPERYEAGVQAAKSRCKISDEQIRAYFSRCLTYQLTDVHRQALTSFDAAIQQLDAYRHPDHDSSGTPQHHAG